MGRGRRYAGAYNASSDVLNTINPPLRDTVTVNPNSWIVLRFADHNPGIWPLHCHIDWHMAAGLYMILYETPAVPTPIPDSEPTEPPVSSWPIVVGTVLCGVGAMFCWFLYDYYYNNCCHANALRKSKIIQKHIQQELSQDEALDMENNPNNGSSL